MTEQRVENRALEVLNSRFPKLRGVQARQAKRTLTGALPLGRPIRLGSTRQAASDTSAAVGSLTSAIVERYRNDGADFLM